MQSTTIGIDLAKSVFQIAIADQQRRIVKRQRLSRSQFQRFLVDTAPARLVMEGCASAHHWGRVAQSQGHHVRILHAGYVRPYVRRNKTDAADAEALVRADGDPELKPIPVKAVHQQALQSLHRIRLQWQRTRVARINEARGLLAEFGVVLPRGTVDMVRRLHDVAEQLPELLQFTFTELIAEIGECQDRIKRLDRTLTQVVAADPVGQRLLTINGVGTTIASALLGSVSDIQAFKRGRVFASWLGLTPREHSSGSTRNLGRISRRGDIYLRMLLIHGARAALLAAKRAQQQERQLNELQRWALNLQERAGHNKAAVGLANKMARIIWAVWTKDQTFDGDYAARFRD
jgi:transposase